MVKPAHLNTCLHLPDPPHINAIDWWLFFLSADDTQQERESLKYPPIVSLTSSTLKQQGQHYSSAVILGTEEGSDFRQCKLCQHSYLLSHGLELSSLRCHLAVPQCSPLLSFTKTITCIKITMGKLHVKTLKGSGSDQGSVWTGVSSGSGYLWLIFPTTAFKIWN